MTRLGRPLLLAPLAALASRASLPALLLLVLASGVVSAQTLGETRLVERPTLHVVAIGIDDYPDGEIEGQRVVDLLAAENDAAQMRSAFEDVGEGFFGAVESHRLLGAEATGDAIRAALRRVATAAEPEDTIVFTYSGQAMPGSLLPHDLAPVPLETLGLWLSQVPARRMVAVLDAQGDEAGLRAMQAAIFPSAAEATSRSVTLVVPDGVSFEVPAGDTLWGALTHALVGGLLGTFDGNHDTVVSAHEITEAALNRRLRDLGVPTRARILSVGPDFPLGRSRVLDPYGGLRLGTLALRTFTVSDHLAAARATFPERSVGYAKALVRALASPEVTRRVPADSLVAALAREVHGMEALGIAPGKLGSLTEFQALSLLQAVVVPETRTRNLDEYGGQRESALDQLLWNIAGSLEGSLMLESEWEQSAQSRRLRAHLESPETPLDTLLAYLPGVTAESGVDLELSAVVSDSAVAVLGRAWGERVPVSVTIGGRPVEYTASGRFAAALPIANGATTYTVRAIDTGGAVVERTLTVEPPALRRTELAEDGPTLLPPRRDMAVFFATDEYLNGISRLVNPIADAEAIAAELHDRHRFDTLVVRNPTKEDIERTLIRYEDYVFADDEDSQLFVFFAGHGTYVKRLEQGYIQPADAVSGDRYTYLPMRDLAVVLDGMTNFRRILLVLDVCYGGAVFNGVRDGGDGELYAEADREELLRRIADDRSRLALTSGGVKYVSDGVRGRHSPFAARVVEALRGGAGPDRLLFFHELVTEVQKMNRQEPQAGTFGVYGDRGGLTFVFAEQDPDAGPQ